MEELATWLFKSVIWITGFGLIYLLFLQNERFFLLNRIFLVTGIISSLVFPFVTVRYVISVPALQADVAAGPITSVMDGAGSGISAGSLIMVALWLAGAFFIGVRQLVRTLAVAKSINRSEKISSYPVKLVRSSDYVTPFSFFSCVVVNPSIEDNEAREIMNHEMAHVRQMHWVDLLLSGLLCTVQWLSLIHISEPTRR